MQSHAAIQPQVIDPILTLHVRSSVASLCFVSQNDNHATTTTTTKNGNVENGHGDSNDTDDEDSSCKTNSEDDESSIDDDDDDLNLRCSTLPIRENKHYHHHHMGNPKSSNNNTNTNARMTTMITPQTLSRRWMASCHADGELLLWDLARQQVTAKISTNREPEGPGLLVRRLSSFQQQQQQQQEKFLYHTRDPLGIVSLHALDRDDNCPIVRQFETYSQTFCAAAPCMGDPHLLALPSRQDNVVTVIDTRDPVPIVVIPFQSHGMVTSLAMTCSSSNSGLSGDGFPILACGMESGSLFLYDVSQRRIVSSSNNNNIHNMTNNKGECKLSREPILALDLAPSIKSNSSSSSSSSVVAIAGMAGDAGDLSELPVSEQGRVALVKASYDKDNLDNNSNDGKTSNNNNEMTTNGVEETTSTSKRSSWKIRIRARVSTCRIDNNDNDKSTTPIPIPGGKPGVSICRFQPGRGRLWAVGGWDRRVRLFERSTGAPLAILRGHDNSVKCLDWAPDAEESGLLASSSGGNDKRIHIWQCFSKGKPSS